MRAPFALLLLASLVASADDRLEGTWRSDQATSMEFARAHSILEPRQSDFLEGILGRLELTFAASKMRYRIPDADVAIRGKSQHFVGSDDQFDFRVLGSDSDSVAVLILKHYGQDRIWHVHFVGNDSFWIYSEDGDYGLRDLNFREYFTRVE